MKNIFRHVIALIFVFQNMAWAASWDSGAVAPGFQPVPAPTPAVSPIPSPAPAAAPATTGNEQTGSIGSLNPNLSVPSQNHASKGSEGSNNSASQIAQQMGQGLLSAGSSMMSSCAASQCSCCPAAAMLLAMGALGLAQSGANKGAGGQNGYVAGTSAAGYNPYSGDYDTTGSLDNVEPFKPNAEMVKNLNNSLSKGGAKFDGKKIDLANGKSFNLGDVSNQQAMANAGVTPSEYSKAMALAADLEKKASADSTEKVGAHTASSGFEGGSGGGSGSRSPAGADDGMGGSGGAAKAIDPKPTVAGMTRNFNGENIGVAGDSIFAMMTRRYEQKKKEASFLPPEANPN